MREYRQRRKDRGQAVPRGGKASGKTATKWKRGEFIAWDGEGINTGRMIDPATEEHRMTLFANSRGYSIRDDAGLPTARVLELLLTTAAKHPDAIHVIYSGTYDLIHALHDVPLESLQTLASDGEVTIWPYHIKYIPRKSFYIRDNTTGRSVTLWDVIGFFQSSFVDTIRKWLGADYPDLPMIEAGKLQRSHFAGMDAGYIERYNDAELTALVKICELLRESVESAGLVLSRWDGAGAVAAAIYKKHGIKQHISELPEYVELAARHAYFGGRIECLQFGYSRERIYQYDVNSAYPAAMINLPSLGAGEWVSMPWVNPMPGVIALAHVEWSVTDEIGPFPFRYADGTIHYPRAGAGWYHAPEVIAALEHATGIVNVLTVYEWVPASDEKPFAFVGEYFDRRKKLIAGEIDGPPGLEKVIKLGLNSLYGKLAQNAGYNPERGIIPPYHSIVYAGMITSATRARLYEAAMQSPESIVMMMTDGIVSTKPLDLETPKEKILGLWEQTVSDEFVSVQSGIYANARNAKWFTHSRGVERAALNDDSFIATILAAWKESPRGATVRLDSSVMVGLKKAAINQQWYERRGCWTSGVRVMDLEPGIDGKRIRIDIGNQSPGKDLVRTEPNHNLAWFFGARPLSTAYLRPWDRPTEWGDFDEESDGIE